MQTLKSGKTAKHLLTGGPYDGQELTINIDAFETLVFSVGGYFGKYKSYVDTEWLWRPLTR